MSNHGPAYGLSKEVQLKVRLYPLANIGEGEGVKGTSYPSPDSFL